MKHRLKKNTAGEEKYVRDLERRGPLERVERGEATLLSEAEYPEPLRRFLVRERSTLRVPLSPSAKKKLEQLSKTSKIDIAELARRWIEQGIAREAG
jgi:hypothetical protein